MSGETTQSNGMGVDSAAWFFGMLDGQLPRVDLDRLTLVTAMTGNESVRTQWAMEEFWLPVLEKLGVRYLQVARTPDGSRDRYVVLDDSHGLLGPHTPGQMTMAGPVTLGQEMLRAGAIPLSSSRTCSHKWKGEVLDALPIRPLCVSATVTTVMVRVYEPDRVDDLLPGGIPAQLRICVRDNGSDGDWNAAAVWTWEELARLTGAGWKVGRQFYDQRGPGFWLHRAIGSEWAAAWPDTITLDEAAEEIDFDLFEGDDPSMVLTKGQVLVNDVAAYSHAEMAANDTDDRFEPLEAALAAGGRHVPPVVVLPGEGLRDGHHRVALAQRAGLTTIPAYLPRTENPSQ